MIKKVKNAVLWTYVISDLKGEEMLRNFYERELKKKIKKRLKLKSNEEIGNKLYVKWKGYDNSFNNWIDKKDIV